MRYIIVPIEAEENGECGECGHLDYYACRKFFTNGHFTGLASPDGKPLRCPECLSAEAKMTALIEAGEDALRCIVSRGDVMEWTALRQALAALKEEKDGKV